MPMWFLKWLEGRLASLKIHIPAFVPMLKGNEHLAHGPLDIDLGPDVVQVARCKECKHKYFKDFSAFCPHRVGPLRPDGFCERGEREVK